MKYIDAEKVIAYLTKTMESYKSKMVDPRKYPIDHIDLMAFLAREYQAIIANVKSLDTPQQEQTEKIVQPATKGWVAKDYDGTVRLFFLCKPQRIVEKRYRYWYGGPNASKQLPNGSFPDLKWEDEPIEVTLLIRNSL